MTGPSSAPARGVRARLGWLLANDSALIGLTCILTAGPSVFEFARRDAARRLFIFCASDTFYYLTVARNIARTGRVSFDGEHLTNGFHPLWQALIALFAFIARVTGAGDIFVVAAAIAAGIGLTTAAVFLLGRALRRDDTGLNPLCVILPFGATSFVLMPLMQGWYRTLGRPSTTLWGAVNGMETALVVFTYAACALGYIRAPRTRRGAVVLGLCFAGLSLARLDHTVFALVMAASLFVLESEQPSFGATATAVLVGVMGLYVATNRVFFGMALPVSGTIKSTFPHLTDDNARLMRMVWTRARTLPASQGHRALQLAIPAAASAATLAVAMARALLRLTKRRRAQLARASRIEWLLISTAGGALGLFLYDFLFVPRMNQGYWYFPVSSLFVSMVALEGAWGLLSKVPGRRNGWARLALALVLSAGVLWGYSLVHPGTGDPGAAKFFFDEAPKVRHFYDGRPVRMVELDDGIVTFATGIPAMSGTGLTIDKDAVSAAGAVGMQKLGQSKLLELGIARGYDRFSTFLYAHDRLTRSSSSADIRRAYRELIGTQAAACRLEVEYLSQDRTFSIIHALCPALH